MAMLWKKLMFGVEMSIVIFNIVPLVLNLKDVLIWVFKYASFYPRTENSWLIWGANGSFFLELGKLQQL